MSAASEAPPKGPNSMQSRVIHFPAVEIVVCETCRAAHHDTSLEGPHGPLLAEKLARALEGDAADGAAPPNPILLRTTRCLWACRRGCNAYLRAPGRSGYVLTELDPTDESAAGLAAFARLYAQSKDGSVPFRTWPDAVRGHFLCRIPPTDPEESR